MRDIAAYFSVPAAIEFEAEHDWPRVREECHELLRYTRQAIGGLMGLEQICSDSSEWPKGQMTTIPLPAYNAIACPVDRHQGCRCRCRYTCLRRSTPLSRTNGTCGQSPGIQR